MYNYANPLFSPTYPGVCSWEICQDDVGGLNCDFQDANPHLPPVPVVVGHYIDRIQKRSRFMINFHCLADVFFQHPPAEWWQVASCPDRFLSFVLG